MGLGFNECAATIYNLDPFLIISYPVIAGQRLST